MSEGSRSSRNSCKTRFQKVGIQKKIRKIMCTHTHTRTQNERKGRGRETEKERERAIREEENVVDIRVPWWLILSISGERL